MSSKLSRIALLGALSLSLFTVAPASAQKNEERENCNGWRCSYVPF